MRDPLERLEKIAARARREVPPEVDVSDAVWARIAEASGSPHRTWELLVAAVVVTMILSRALYQAITDPLWTLFQSASTFIP